MKSNRQKKILEIVHRYPVETQDDLIDRLNAEGFAVTQATVSRDIRELQLTKVLTAKGKYRYMLPKKEDGIHGVRFNASLVESVLSVDYVLNMIVIKTYPGLANAVAAGIDGMVLSDVLGCIAGDDTIFVATRSEAAAKSISEQVRTLKERS